MRKFFISLLLAFSFMSLSGDEFFLEDQPIFAAETSLQAEQTTPPKTLTNNWFGYYDHLKCHGVDFSASYIWEVAYNTHGGERRGWGQAASLGVNFDFDLEYFFDWSGWDLYNSWVFRTGNNISALVIGNEFNVCQVFGGQNLRLNELFIRNTSPNKTLFKAGRLDAGNDFLASPLYQYFLNNGFCGNPVAVFKNGPFSAYPNSQWAAYLSFYPYKRILTKWGIYNTNTDASKNRYNGFDLRFQNEFGVQLITEWSYLNNHDPCSTGYKGNYKAGFFYYTGRFAKFTGGMPKGNYGYYFLFDQVIYRDSCNPNRILTPFVSLLFAPKNRNEFPFFTSSGLIFKGMFPGRPRDVTALGVVYGSYSENLRRVEQSARSSGVIGPFGNQPQNYESIIEFNYTFQVTDWLQLTPDTQYIINPKGYGTTPNAFVVAMQIAVVI